MYGKDNDYDNVNYNYFVDQHDYTHINSRKELFFELQYYIDHASDQIVTNLLFLVGQIKALD